MSQGDGFLTLFSIKKGWENKYKQLKWLWIAVSAAGGLSLGLLSWFYNPELVVVASIVGTLSGAALFFIFLKLLGKQQKGSRDQE